MKASPPSISSYRQVPPIQWGRLTTPAPRFGGIGDAAANLVGIIDSSRPIELLTSDFGAMVVPRSYLAFHCRGSDDGRETFLREFSGLIGNVLLMGWAGYGMTRMLGDSVNVYNPKGIPGRAWITAQNLDAFGKIYLDEVKNASNADEARQNFIHKVLGGLESGDKDFSIEARLSCMEQLDEASRGKMLEQMQKLVPNPDEVKPDDCKASLKKLVELKQQLRNPAQKALYTKEREKLRRKFFDAGWGKLSETAKADLAAAYAKKKVGEVDSKTLGTVPFDELANTRAEAKKATFKQLHGLDNLEGPKLENALKYNGFDWQKEFLKQRLSLSLSDLKYNVKDFLDTVDSLALRYNLTSTVNLHHQLSDKTDIRLSSNRGTLLKEMKHFIEHYADRATYPHTSENWNGEIKKQIEDKLVGTSPNDHLLCKFIPQENDGLITAAMKARGAYTWAPMAICMAAAGAFTFYNNYLTMKKHNGQKFFPGEGMPPTEGAKKNPLPSTGTQGQNRLYNNFGTFPNFPQFRNNQGGIIA